MEMIKDVKKKDDGRYIIFYDFKEDNLDTKNAATAEDNSKEKEAKKAVSEGGKE